MALSALQAVARATEMDDSTVRATALNPELARQPIGKACVAECERRGLDVTTRTVKCSDYSQLGTKALLNIIKMPNTSPAKREYAQSVLDARQEDE